MSEEEKNYNPFTSVGRFNIERYLYAHKKQVLGLTVLLIVLLFSLMFFVWEGGKSPPKAEYNPILDIPPPRYGVGPYGYGLYAPPRALFENPPSVM